MVIFRTVEWYLCLPLLIECVATNSNIDTFQKTLKVLERQNSRKFDGLITLSDTNIIPSQNDLLRKTIEDQIFKSNPYFMNTMTAKEHNISKSMRNIENLLSAPMRFFLAILDYKTSPFIKQIVTVIPKEYFQKHTWLLVNPYDCDNISEKESFRGIVDSWNKHIITLDSQLYILNGNLSFASLLEVYKECKDGEIKIQEVLKVSNNTDSLEQNTKLWDRRNNLMGCNIRVAYVDKYPLITTNKSNAKFKDTKPRYTIQSGNKTVYGGVINRVELIKQLSLELNFSTTWVLAEDNSYGVFDEKTRQWNGLINLLLNDKADLSNSFLAVTSLRSTAVSFTIDIGRYKHGLYMAKPSISASWFTFIEVFDVKYWLALFGMALFCSIILATFLSLEY